MKPYRPHGARFYDLRSNRHMILVDEAEPDEKLRGWLVYLHPDGQWVTLREATDDDRDRVARFVTSALTI